MIDNNVVHGDVRSGGPGPKSEFGTKVKFLRTGTKSLSSLASAIYFTVNELILKVAVPELR